MISHELRTPLNGMLGFAQLLKMSDQPVLNEEQNEQADGILDSGGYLLSLIEELLDLSKIESHKLRVAIEEISLADILSESVLILNPAATGFNIKIINNVENNYLVKADAKRLKQVFINLIYCNYSAILKTGTRSTISTLKTSIILVWTSSSRARTHINISQ